MRVVAGTAKGRRLAVPTGNVTRPTPGRVREAIFNSLYSQGLIENSRVLDLYAGTGALGIEALSRGAAEAVFLEQDARAVTSLRKNLTSTGLAERATIIVADVEKNLTRLHTEQAASSGSGKTHQNCQTHEDSHVNVDTTLTRLDISDFCKRHVSERFFERSFDLAVVDPPYSFERWEWLLKRIPAKLVVAQSNRRIDIGQEWEIRGCRSYGRTVVTFGFWAGALIEKDTLEVNGLRQ